METETYDLPIVEAAEKLKTTELNILMHIKRKILDGVEKDGKWYLSRRTFDNFLDQDGDSKANVVSAKSHCGHGCGSCG